MNCLIIDKSKLVCNIVASMLDDLGHDCTMCFNTEEGLTALDPQNNETYNVVFIDITTVESKQNQLVKKLILAKKNLGMTIIAMAPRDKVKESQISKFDFFIDKPTNKQDLLNIINKVISL